jgi:hypothetical protein
MIYADIPGEYDHSLYDKELVYTSTYKEYNYYYSLAEKTYFFTRSFDNSSFSSNAPTEVSTSSEYYGDAIYISAPLIREIAEEVLSKSYKQVSLFFEDDKAAELAAEELKAKGYVAVPSTSTYNMESSEALVTVIASLLLAIVWFVSIIFLAFFISLCMSRTLSAFKGEMAIMRSMGIAAKTIRIGMYTRMLIALIPALIIMAASALIIFTTPKLSGYFTYLYAWQYGLIILGMLILTIRTTHKQIRKLFGISVKKSLRGGESE